MRRRPGATAQAHHAPRCTLGWLAKPGRRVAAPTSRGATALTRARSPIKGGRGGKKGAERRDVRKERLAERGRAVLVNLVISRLKVVLVQLDAVNDRRLTATGFLGGY